MINYLIINYKRLFELLQSFEFIDNYIISILFELCSSYAYQVLPAIRLMSSAHLFGGIPLFPWPSLGRHSMFLTCFVPLLFDSNIV